MSKSVLIGGFTPAAILALASISILYSWWVALLVFLVPFVVINVLILYVDYRKWLRDRAR